MGQPLQLGLVYYILVGDGDIYTGSTEWVSLPETNKSKQ
jgi:hypothetical protein